MFKTRMDSSRFFYAGKINVLDTYNLPPGTRLFP